jgi:hypothetical protein
MDPEALDYGGSLSFQVKVMEGFSYLWNNENNATGNNSKKISKSGKYWVKIRDTEGNISLASDTLYVGVEPPSPPPDETALTGMEGNCSFTYNNPVKEFLYIHYFAPQKMNLSVQLMDLRGCVMISQIHHPVWGYNQVQLAVSGLESGIYILRLSSDQGIISKKVIVENP